MDPATFLNLFLTPGGDNGSGWWDKKYADLLEAANHTADKQKRYELLARRRSTCSTPNQQSRSKRLL